MKNSNRIEVKQIQVALEAIRLRVQGVRSVEDRNEKAAINTGMSNQTFMRLDFEGRKLQVAAGGVGMAIDALLAILKGDENG